MAVLAASALASTAAAQEVLPPSVLELPTVELPAEVEGPADGSLPVTVDIAADGSASVHACDAPPTLCELVEAAVAAARFAPATRDGEPVDARVVLELAIVEAEVIEPDELAEQSGDAPPVERPPIDDPSYGAVAEVGAPEPAGARRMELVELREVPGAFGDPFRAVMALPGVVPIVSGLPYFYLRGSPPSGTLYVYDDIPIPTLYHFALGPAVIHPRMIGDVQLYSGVAPGRYGRLTGGVIVGEGPGETSGRVSGEAELRLIDVTGYVETPVGEDGSFAVAGRYGYPGLLLSLLVPDVSLAYWDYQLRADVALGDRDRAQLVALGSFDSFTQIDDAGDENSLRIEFHRAEARLIRRVRTLELGSALRVGWERSAFDEELQIDALTLGPRMWIEHRTDDVRFRVGGDLIGSSGGLSQPDPTEDIENVEEDDPLLFDVAARSVGGIYAELEVELSERVTLLTAGRADFWATGSGFEGSLDPRVRLTLQATENVTVSAAVGVVRQPAVFFIPLPGLAEVALDRGLQTAIQSEAGVGLDLGEGVELEAQAFFHRFDGLLFFDAFFRDEQVCDTAGCRAVEIEPRADGNAFGGELFIRRRPGHRISGWVSYTLAWATAEDVLEVDYTPQYDVRHVANLVAAWELGGGFAAGARIHLRSGKPISTPRLEAPRLNLVLDVERLPWFYRMDAQVSYGWRTSWGEMRVTLEWFNVTLAKEPLDLDCDARALESLLGPTTRGCDPVYGPALFVPNLGVRGAF